MKRILAVIIMMTAVTAGWGMEFSFSAYPGYKNAALEIEANSPTPWSVKLRERGSEAVLQTKSFDSTTSVTVSFTTLDFDTVYEVDLQVDDGTYSAGRTGYAFKTLERYHFTKRMIKRDRASELVMQAITETVPDKKQEIFDKIEELAKKEFIEAKELEKAAWEKAISVINQTN